MEEKEITLTQKIEELFEAFEEFDGELTPLKNRRELKQIYDPRGIPLNLKYGFIEEENLVIFSMPKGDFNNFEYYAGYEYARKDISWKIEFEGNIIIAYSDNERALKMYEYIEEMDSVI